MAWAHVQGPVAYSFTGTEMTRTFASNTTTGNLIRVSATNWNSTDRSITGIVDNGGVNSYSEAVNIRSGSAEAWEWYAKNITGGTTPIVTMTFSVSGDGSMAVNEYSGLDTTAPLHDTGTNTGTGTSQSVTIDPTVACMVGGVCGYAWTMTTITPEAGVDYNERQKVQASGISNISVVDRPGSASDTIDWTTSGGVSDAWAAVAVAFKEPAAGDTADADSDGAGTATATGAADSSSDVFSVGVATLTAEGASTSAAEFSAVGSATGEGDASSTNQAAAQSIAEAAAVANGFEGGFTAAGNAAGTATAIAAAAPSWLIQAPDPGFDGTSPGVLAFSSNVTAGSLIVLGLRIGSTIANVLSITDTQNNSYILDHTQDQTTDGHQIRVYHVDGANAGPTTVTVLLDLAVTLRMVMAEYTRVSSADRTASAQATDAAPSSGTTEITRDAEELLVGLVGTGAASAPAITAGAQYTKRATASRLAIEDRTVGVTGSYFADWSLDASSNWSAAIVTYRVSQPVMFAAGTATGIASGVGETRADGYSVGAATALASGGAVVAFSGGSIQTFDLTWESVGGATGYDIGYDTNSGEPYANIIDVGNVTTYLLGPLTAATWYVNVRSYDGGGPDVWGTEIVGTINANYAAAGAAQTTADAFAAGAGTAEAAGISAAVGALEGPGAATAEAVGESTLHAVFVSAAASTLTAEGTSEARADFTSDGVATGTADGASSATAEEGFFSSGGEATAISVSAILAEAAGSSAGTSSAVGDGALTLTAEAFSAGVSFGRAEGEGGELEEVADGVYRIKRRKRQEQDDEEVEVILQILVPYILKGDFSDKDVL